MCYFMGQLVGEPVMLALKTQLFLASLQKCAEIIVAHLGYLNYTQYTVIVGFEHLKVPIKEMNFTVSIPAGFGVYSACLFRTHPSIK